MTAPQNPSALPSPRTDYLQSPKKRRGWPWIAGTLALVFALAGLLGSTAAQATTVVSSAAANSKSHVQAIADTVPVRSVLMSTQVSSGQSNAARAAEQYIEMMAFSRSGLIDQLEYEGYSTSDATYGADSVHANWNEQAARAAKQYLQMMSFSKSGLVEQLEYEGFTPSQAQYGANATY